MNPQAWNRQPEPALLERRIQDLNLAIPGTSLEVLIQRLHDELALKGLVFQPPCFLADEWFCPVGIPAIGIPFYLAHPRLRRLEQKFMLEVEGGTRSEFMKLIRHETGHAYSYAYNLYKKPVWRQHFGYASQEYRETYHPRPYSRSFVLHLDNWYAQSHPDEDFAETFAVWLTPGLNWRRKYRGWKALEKLECVDRLMKSIAGKPPRHLPKFREREYSGLNMKLKSYFRKKRKLYEESYPDFYDKDLRHLFTDSSEERSDIKAHRYLQSSRARITASVSFWTKEKKYTIDQLMQSLIDRTRELGLFVRREHADLDVQLTAYVSSLITNYLFTGKFKRSK